MDSPTSPLRRCASRGRALENPDSQCPHCDAAPARAGEKTPFRELLTIALPSVLTMTSYTVMQFVDAIMVSRITPPDPVYVAAQGNGGMAVWLVVCTALGVLQVVNTYVSQNLGAGRPQRGSAYAWAAIWISLAFAILVIPCILALPSIFAWQGHAGSLLRFETQYASVMGAGAFMLTASRGLQHYFYGMHRPRIVLVAALAGNSTNIFFNWLLIYGNLGAPALGVAGAAWGTVAGVTVELAIPLVLFLGPAWNARYATRAPWKPSWAPMRDLFKTGWPGALMFANEMVCWWYLMSYLTPAGARAQAQRLGQGADAIATAGDVANAAGWAALRYMHMSFMPAVGMSIAVTALVGRCMGMARPDLAARRAWLGLKIAIGYMGACALAFILFREQLIDVFLPADTPLEKRELMIAAGAQILIAAAVFQIFDATAITISGALRGAGDTVWPGVVTVICSWVCIVAGGHAMIALFPTLGALGPWVAASLYIMVLGVLLLIRFIRGRWKSINLLTASAMAAVAESRTSSAPAAPALLEPRPVDS